MVGLAVAYDVIVNCRHLLLVSGPNLTQEANLMVLWRTIHMAQQPLK